MALFTYQGRNRQGDKVDGEISGDSKELVAKQLLRSGITPLAIKAKKLVTKKGKSILEMDIGSGNGKVKLKNDELIFFSRQMYTLIKSGVPMTKALEGLGSTSDNKNLTIVVTGLRDSLDQGLDLTGAMARQPDIFPELYTNLVRIGEATGNLADIFEELAHFLEKEKEVKRKVKGALSYPITVLSVVSIGMIVVNVFVLPAFSKMFAGFGADLPLPTQILIGFSDFMREYGLYILGAIVGAVVGFFHYIKTPVGKFQWHKVQYKLPLVGKLLLQNAISRFARTLSITSRAGVPVEQALQIIAPAMGNKYMEKKILSMRSYVERGESITHAITQTQLFPGIVIQMISVGEEAGTIDEMVGEVSEYYDREIDVAVKRLAAAIEPIIIGFIAGIVLILALGIFLPMISLMGAIQK